MPVKKNQKASGLLKAINTPAGGSSASRTAKISAAAAGWRRTIEGDIVVKVVKVLTAVKTVERDVRAGKVPPAEREWAIYYCMKDPASYEAFAGRGRSRRRVRPAR